MKIIQENIPLISKLIGNQEISQNISVRPIAYSLEISIDGGSLLYSTLTRCVVFIEEKEKGKDDTIEFLKSNWFLVPIDFDDKQFLCQIRSLAKLFVKKQEGISGYTILTTMECNARCYYCYEKHRAKMPMSDEIIEKVGNYIVNTHSKGKIVLKWFGGEPLYNVKAIDKICNRLIGEDIDFSSSIISNGYLFDDEIIKRAKNIWNLRNAQITLDGTERVYNRSKSFIYQKVNAYQRVLDNIGKLIENEINVQIRLNVSVKNADDLISLLDELKDKFGVNKYLSVYCHPLFEIVDSKVNKLVVNSRKELFGKLQILRDKIFDIGYSSKKSKLPCDIKLNSCMADNLNSIMILPDGKLGKCEHYSDNHYVGNIDDGICNKDEINRFKEKMHDIDACKSCPCYPDCYKLKLCENDNYCFPELQTSRIEEMKCQMLNTYNSYLKKQQINEEENDEIEIQC